MSSSVFFRFKSQKDPSRVTFDGTGISVFELKRDIIAQNKLGDGTDFELVINAEDTNEEYDDDTSIIPRSTTVIAKRLPAVKPGRGGAARYVSGKMPPSAKNYHRQDASTTRPVLGMPSSTLSAMRGAQTEDERIAAMFQMGADDWAQQQQQMANAAPVHRGGSLRGKPQNLPDHPPPPGYVCYRCGEKGHWIMECPTNNDPNFDGRPRIKRTTGIPKSFLKTIEKPAALINDGTLDDTKQPTGVMVNSEGEWVVAEPDQAAWDKYQAQTKISAAAQNAVVEGRKELQDRGLECRIDKRLFVDPTKTPCCQTTYCRECIQNALLDNDLHCPHCSADNVPIDDLIPDDEMATNVRNYEMEKASIDELAKEKAKSPTKQELEDVSRSKRTASPSAISASRLATRRNHSPEDSASKKRPAELPLQSDRKAPAPSSATSSSTRGVPAQPNDFVSKQTRTTQQWPVTNDPHIGPSGFYPVGLPNGPGFMGIGMGMGMPTSMGMQTPMMMPTAPSLMGNDWSNMWGMGYQQNMNMGGGAYPNGTLYNGGFSQQMPRNPAPRNLLGMNNTRSNGIADSSQFANQQRSNNDEESAYFRKPVNPGRQYNRRNWNQRPADYREI